MRPAGDILGTPPRFLVRGCCDGHTYGFPTYVDLATGELDADVAVEHRIQRCMVVTEHSGHISGFARCVHMHLATCTSLRFREVYMNLAIGKSPSFLGVHVSCDEYIRGFGCIQTHIDLATDTAPCFQNVCESCYGYIPGCPRFRWIS